MLSREESIRMSQSYIDRCDAVVNEVNGWLRVSELVQYEVAVEFGFTDRASKEYAVNCMRRAQYIYPDEPLFKSIPVYVRNNLARQCDFKKGDVVPNVTIHRHSDPDGESGPPPAVELYNTFDKGRFNVVLASSHT